MVRLVTTPNRAPTAAGTVSSLDRVPDRPWRWHLSRAAALLLVVLVPLHFAVTFIADDVGSTTARSMSEQLSDPTWRILTWLVLALALVHGTLSADAAVRRRLPGGVGSVLTVVVGVIAGVAFAAASWALGRGVV